MTVALRRALRRVICLACMALLALATAAQQMPNDAGDAPMMPATGQPPIEQKRPGTIRGIVVDATGAALVGARVTLSREHGSSQVITDDDGQFSFADVAPGDFHITVSAPGFAPQTSAGTVNPGQVYLAPAITLTVAIANTAVEVVASRRDLAEDQVKVEEKQRMLGVFPNFYVSYVPDPLPLTAKQKFELAWRTMVDPATFVMTGVTAGVQQGQSAFNGYGQGASGYGRRFGASYGDSVTETFIGSALLPALLKQDPRYFYKGTGSKRSRLLYAVENVVACKGDNKRWQPNYSSLLGSLAAGGLSNLYYPAKDRGTELMLDNTVTGLGTGAVINVLQEFVIRRLTRNAPHHN